MRMSLQHNYLFRVLLTLDQTLNVILFNGGEDHTISGRVGHKAKTTGLWYWCVLEKLINTLFWFDPDHCRRSIENGAIFQTTTQQDIRHFLRLIVVALLVYLWW
ncbi:hypothetical protein [Pseudoalteromonas sp. S16_S37]|uniref:hypothetical protein n=1 Tax=Pseudoalteromonas sp. S16_S37 TaxID=2720228 RepID=UPI0016810A05|nr:hypothetical protein [Pseudoalteromonas sp. S16_S37]MBD1582807.1 hypothetical protein [Pseudoalteromonas sp. S16_S37]